MGAGGQRRGKLGELETPVGVFVTDTGGLADIGFKLVQGTCTMLSAWSTRRALRALRSSIDRVVVACESAMARTFLAVVRAARLDGVSGPDQTTTVGQPKRFLFSS
jgi:hypothetical protein